ncbi:IucA/IucC family C-terminal-domain containing protein [Paenibacillus sp. S150]|uniref:IucA/IucC family C-terminal-domain containing protein n=1 Tax=Paenibacillus sp. S150 TaxID=2749826 RepID=UPI001C580F76|nr:IucA/IucC family C-terminal-domain containing protein [Paenibacillus sp. S150]MBW4080655.1 (2Fe-2S)-binding protein [Paenibacillus sp. S150]
MNSQSPLEREEWAGLSLYFGLQEHAGACIAYPVQASELIEAEACSDYLDRLSVLLKSPSRGVAASQFIKRYAFLTAAPMLYAMTVFNKGLDFSAGNCRLPSPSGRSWLEHIGLDETNTSIPGTDGRQAWRDTLLQALFAGNLGRLIQVMSKVAHVPKAILWENVAVRVFSLYEKRIGLQGELHGQARRQADFQYLIDHAPGALFGEKHNPLKRFYSRPGSSSVPDSHLRVRKTCCFYYEVAGSAEYCSNCPKKRS